MCIFSGPATVSGTRIFGRVEGDEQYVVYQMAFGATDDVAMVLPLPVAPGSGEAAVRFVDLSTFPKFFDALEMMFPRPAAFQFLELSASRQTLEVQRVGDYEASYVPSIADFARLDRRFRLASEVWDALPTYADFGFAVFQLRQERGLLQRIGLKKVEPAGPRDVHPMAFAFRTRTPDRVFFPTVHVHDGVVHATATFDHELYCQHATPPAEWMRSPGPADAWAIAAAKGVLAAQPVHHRSVHGDQPNSDVYA